MAASNTESILRVPGDLIWNPTDLGSPTSYGGTILGTCRDKTFSPSPVLRPIWNETAGSYQDVIYGGERVLFRTVVRYPDSDLLLYTMFKAISSGSSGVHFLFRPGGTTANTRAGTSLGASSGKLMFAARARTTSPFLILYNAVPALDDAAQLQFSLGEEYGLACAWYGTPDSSGRVYDCGRRANLVL